MNSSSSVSSKEASPSAHIHTDDHCKDKTNVQIQTTQRKRKGRTLFQLVDKERTFSIGPSATYHLRFGTSVRYKTERYLSLTLWDERSGNQKRASRLRNLLVTELEVVRSKMKLPVQGTFLRC
ncbi:hypothetical protein LR48_Vigan10g256000 [Vigna angularis]|uniref:Uncharacterized protein n=1 Tax=Phaseolus angularis TaxID=3914 RepID=A0A0L9VNY4_PHAAN|nr:hypothetical protein LR48_Vigan10g256000 [Vigna angularis]